MSRDMEMLQYMQMRYGIGTGGLSVNAWVELICLVGLFALILFRRDAIVNWKSFRLAYVFLALSMVIPPLVNAFFQAEPGTLQQMMDTSAKNFSSRMLISIGSNVITPAFLALTVIFAFGSLLPRDLFHGPTSTEPPKCPLD